jgi:hypothetical protein
LVAEGWLNNALGVERSLNYFRLAVDKVIQHHDISFSVSSAGDCPSVIRPSDTGVREHDPQNDKPPSPGEAATNANRSSPSRNIDRVDAARFPAPGPLPSGRSIQNTRNRRRSRRTTLGARNEENGVGDILPDRGEKSKGLNALKMLA